jgi:hypothetical protein
LIQTKISIHVMSFSVKKWSQTYFPSMPLDQLHLRAGFVQMITLYMNGGVHFFTCGYVIRASLCRHYWCAWLETGSVLWFLNQIEPHWHSGGARNSACSNRTRDCDR